MREIQVPAIEDLLEGITLRVLLHFRTIFAAFTIVLVISFVAGAQVNSVNFSGTWKMDVSRSESAHQDAPIGPVTMIIKQSGNDLSMEISSSEPHTSAVHSEILVYKLDGTELTTKAADGTPIKSRAHWEGTKLVAETTRDIDKYPVTMSYVYSLDSKGMEMTIIKTLAIQHGYQTQDGKTTATGTDVFTKTRISNSE